MKNKKEMVKRNKLFFLMVSVFMFSVFSILTISAADLTTDNVTIYAPAVSNTGFLSGGSIATNITVEVKTFYANQNWTRVTYYISGAGSTANTTLIATNVSADNKNATNNNFTNQFAFNTSIFEDGNDYTLTVALWNGTQRLNVTRTITINNTLPATPTVTGQTGTVSNGTLNFTATVGDSTTTACYLNFTGTNPGKQSYAASYSGDSCSYKLTSISAQTYVFFFSASDGNDGTLSSQGTVTIDVQDDSTNSITPEQLKKSQQPSKSKISLKSLATKKIFSIPVWFIGIVLAVILIIFFNQGKKRR